jgi:hypothetical protein
MKHYLVSVDSILLMLCAARFVQAQTPGGVSSAWMQAQALARIIYLDEQLGVRDYH